MKIIAATVLVIASIVGFSKAADKSEVQECAQWAAQAAEYPGYYILQWQADQCAAHSISIDAPVRN